MKTKFATIVFLILLFPLFSFSQSDDPNLASSNNSNTLTSSGNNEKNIVEEILQIMVDGNNASTNLKKFIAPSYYITYDLNREYYKIDNYSPSGFEIKSYDSNTGHIIAQIWGTDRSWVHELTFKIVSEDGGLYVYPEKHSDTYIKPWYRVSTYIGDKVTNLSTSGNNEKKLVKEILQIMVDGNNASTNLKKFIAPSYYIAFELDREFYKIDNYSPSGFEINSYDSNTGHVIAQIWGTDRGWVHELTFKIVSEDGGLFVYPEKHSDTYIKPWYKASTYIKDKVAKLSTSGSDEKKMVSDILQIMVDGNSANTKLRTYISPSYCYDNNINISSYLVDNYSPSGYEIKSYSSYTGHVIAHIWGEGKSWVQKLTFKMVVEDGQLFVYPEKHSDTYVKPWFKTESYNQQNESYTLSSSGYEEKKIVKEILQAMVDGNSTSTVLRTYISPSYCTQNGLDINSYLVDNYSPVNFEIKSYNSYSGLVVAHIWGKDRGWVHELTFKVVKESGRLYVYPEKHSETYVKPWYGVRTGIGG